MGGLLPVVKPTWLDGSKAAGGLQTAELPPGALSYWVTCMFPKVGLHAWKSVKHLATWSAIFDTDASNCSCNYGIDSVCCKDYCCSHGCSDYCNAFYYSYS